MYDSGNFLADTYQSLERIGCSIMLTTNHRTGAQLIVHNASLISQRQMPIVDSSQHFHLYSITEPVAGVTPNTAQDDITCGLFTEQDFTFDQFIEHGITCDLFIEHDVTCDLLPE